MPILDSLVEMFEGRSHSEHQEGTALTIKGAATSSSAVAATTTSPPLDTQTTPINVMDDTPLKYGRGHRQYLLIEMRRDSEMGKHMQTFATLAIADKATNISKDAIQQGMTYTVMCDGIHLYCA